MAPIQIEKLGYSTVELYYFNFFKNYFAQKGTLAHRDAMKL